jgi:broad specificity phosphatase PhoE
MTFRLILVVHPPTAASRPGRFPLDEPCDAAGLAPGPLTGTALRKAGRAWTSPLLRARMTAEALGLSAADEPALRDLDCGAWAGEAVADVARAEPARFAAWTEDPEAAPPGGESAAALVARVGAWLDDRLRDTGVAVAVTHAAVIRAAVVHVMRAPPGSFWRIDAEPATWTDLRSDGHRWALRATGVPVSS